MRILAALVVLFAGCGRGEGPVLDWVCPAGPNGCVDAAPAADAAAGDVSVAPSSYTVTASTGATCATLPDRTLWCWGDNAQGALVSGGLPTLVPPVQIGTDRDWVEVSGARGHCALKLDASLHCWGFDQAVPATAYAATPTRVAPTIAWKHTYAGDGHHCALAQDDTLHCWGANDRGQLGLGDTSPRTTITRVPGTWTFASLGNGHTCALKSDHSLWCWGQAGQGQLGVADPVGSSPRSAPTRVGTRSDWTAVSAGGNHACALDLSGAAWCWGENVYGEVGTGGTTPEIAPVRVGSGTFRAIASGGGLTCAIASDGTLWCWGHFGQAAQPDQSRVPKQIDPNPDWEQIAAGYSHACGVRGGEGVRCIGWNFGGQLGTAPSGWSSTVVSVGL